MAEILTEEGAPPVANATQTQDDTPSAGTSDTPVRDLVMKALNDDGSVRDAQAYDQLIRIADGAK